MAKAWIYNRTDLTNALWLTENELRTIESSLDFPKVMAIGAHKRFNNDTIDYLENMWYKLKNTTYLK